MTDAFDIPDFLRIPQQERTAAWRGRRLAVMKFSTKVTRNEDAQTRAFRKMIEKQRAEKKAAKLKYLRENY